MGIFFIYSVKVALCLTAFYLLYKLLLSRETFFGFNRVTLFGMIAAAFVLPLIHLQTAAEAPVTSGFVAIEDFIITAVAADAHVPVVTTAQVCLLIYIIGVAFFLGREVVSLLSLRRLIRSGREVCRDGGVKVVVVKGEVAPFSWFGNVIINEKDYADGSREILMHERAHIAGRHSVDVLLCDLLIIFQWYNPAAWLIKTELKNLHEFEADSAVLAGGVNAAEYQMLLIRKAVGDKLFAMANNLNQSSLKKRITMMLKKKSNPWSRVRTLLALPVAAVAVVAFATPKAESLSNEIKSEGDALVNSVVSSVKATPANATAVGKTAMTLSKDTLASGGRTKSAVSDELLVVGFSNGGKDDKVYDITEEPPSFPGGQAAMMTYLARNIKYPPTAMKNKIEGRVILQFVVRADGSISDTHVMRSISPELDAEAVRVIANMPKWNPGKQDGKPVNVKFTIPVSFKLDAGKTQPDGQKGNVVKINGKNYVPDDTQAISFKGSPYYVVDGKHVEDISNIKPDQIDQINVYKDAKNTTDKYGDAAKNGVIEIILKKK